MVKRRKSAVLVNIVLAIAALFLLGGVYVEMALRGLILDLRTSVRSSDVLLGNFNDAALTLNAVSKREGEHLDTEFRDTIKLTANAKHLVGQADLWLNGIEGRGGLFSEVDKILKDADKGVQLTNTDLLALQTTIERTNKLIADLSAIATDPNIKDTLASISQAGRDAAASVQELLAISKDGHQVADKARETYLKPVTLWWTLVKTLLPLAGSAAQVVK